MEVYQQGRQYADPSGLRLGTGVLDTETGYLETNAVIPMTRDPLVTDGAELFSVERLLSEIPYASKLKSSNIILRINQIYSGSIGSYWTRVTVAVFANDQYLDHGSNYGYVMGNNPFVVLPVPIDAWEDHAGDKRLRLDVRFGPHTTTNNPWAKIGGEVNKRYGSSPSASIRYEDFS